MTSQFENYVRILLAICKQENENFSQLAHDFDFPQEPITCSRSTSFQLTRGRGERGIEISVPTVSWSS